MRGSVSHFVEIISVAAALLVLLVIVWPVVKEAMFGAGEKGQCDFTASLSQITAGITPVECAMNPITIDFAMLEKQRGTAIKEIEKVKSQQEFLNPRFRKYEESTGPERWVMDKIIANEIVSCVDRSKNVKPRELYKLLDPRTTFCMICSRVKFAEDLPWKGRTISPYLWMNLNTYEDKTYFDYWMQRMKPEPFDTNQVYTIDSPLAVVYWADTVDLVDQAIFKLPVYLLGKTINEAEQIYLWEYDKLTSPFEKGGLGCTKIIG